MHNVLLSNKKIIYNIKLFRFLSLHWLFAFLSSTHCLYFILLCFQIFLHSSIHHFVRPFYTCWTSYLFRSHVFLRHNIGNFFFRFFIRFFVQSEKTITITKCLKTNFTFIYCLICLAFSLSVTSALSINASTFFFAFSNFLKARFFFLALASITFLIGLTFISSKRFL